MLPRRVESVGVAGCSHHQPKALQTPEPTADLFPAGENSAHQPSLAWSVSEVRLASQAKVDPRQLPPCTIGSGSFMLFLSFVVAHSALMVSTGSTATARRAGR